MNTKRKPNEVQLGIGKAPSYMTLAESEIWAAGARYGALEMKACITLWLKKQGANVASQIDTDIQIVSE